MDSKRYFLLLLKSCIHLFLRFNISWNQKAYLKNVSTWMILMPQQAKYLINYNFYFFKTFYLF